MGDIRKDKGVSGQAIHARVKQSTEFLVIRRMIDGARMPEWVARME